MRELTLISCSAKQVGAQEEKQKKRGELTEPVTVVFRISLFSEGGNTASSYQLIVSAVPSLSVSLFERQL